MRKSTTVTPRRLTLNKLTLTTLSLGNLRTVAGGMADDGGAGGGGGTGRSCECKTG
jgi:hypothetical protein